MAGKTNQTATLFAQKKLLGKANTSNLKSDSQELIGSSIQAGTQALFGQLIPAVPVQTLSIIQSASMGAPATVEYVDFTVHVVTGTTYDGNDSGAGGDGSQDPGPHCYKLKLSPGYQAATANPSAGTYPFNNSATLHETLGTLQIIPPNFSQAAPNPYILNIYDGDPAGAGNKLALLDEIDWQLDPYNGVLYIQDYDASKIPTHARGFIYVGKMLDDVLDSLSGSSGNSATGSAPNNIKNRSKQTYFITSSVSAGALIQVANTSFSVAGYHPELVDVSLNGALLVSGSTAQVAAKEVDYLIKDDSTLRFSFDLSQDDLLSVNVFASGTISDETILTYTSSSMLSMSRKLTPGSGILFSSASAGIFEISSQRIKTNYTLTAPLSADAILNIAGASFDKGAINQDRIDVYVNGRMMITGSSSDYFITGPNTLYFKFDLSIDDKITTVVQ